MKIQYLTNENIELKSLEILSAIKEHTCRRNFKTDRTRAALIIVDMQKFFLSKDFHAYIPGAPAIIPGIKRLVSVCQANSIPIVYTRHVNNPQNSQMMSLWWDELILEGTEESEIIPDILIENAEIITKSQYDAFYNTSLEDILKSMNISQLIVCGVMTHLCCETTVRSSFVKGYEVFFPVDGTADYDEDYHLATCRALAHGFATITTISDLIEQLKSGANED